MDLPTGSQAIMLSNLVTVRTTPTCRVRWTTTWLSLGPGLRWDLGLNLKLREANRFIQVYGAIGRLGMRPQQVQNFISHFLSMPAAVDTTSGVSTVGEQAGDLDFMLQ